MAGVDVEVVVRVLFGVRVRMGRYGVGALLFSMGVMFIVEDIVIVNIIVDDIVIVSTLSLMAS